MNSYQQLEAAFTKISHINHASTILHWDQEVIMPNGGSDARAQAIAELSSLVHQLQSSSELKDWLDDAASNGQLSPQQQSNLREMRRIWLDANLLPEELVREQSVAQSQCQHQWRSQRPANDWTGFAKNLKVVVELARQQAKIRQNAFATATPYDGLLNLYSNGDSSELITEVFSQLKANIPPMIHTLTERQKSQTRVQVRGNFSKQAQRQLSENVMTFLGFNFERGRLDESTHPFSTGNFGDQRITTRYSEEDFVEALYATIHETGHSRYEAGLPPDWQTQPVGASRNMSIHESQSLFFEKHIGASPAFCSWLAAQANHAFQLATTLSAEQFSAMIGWVEPGYIRVNADELTYPLHIVLRYEIESALINGDMEVDDIPDAWDEKMQAYLGLRTEGDYRNGCMQDIHWTMGAFGYFPSYTLGAVNAAQLRFAMEQSLGPIDEILAKGDITPIAEWLAQHIWQQACFIESQEIIRRATGKTTDAQSLLQHFVMRYRL